MRAFIAIKVDPNERLREILQSIKHYGKAVEPENIHLTLKFLGEVSGVENIISLLSAIKFRAFDIEVGGIGAFPSLRKGRVLFLNAAPRDLLTHLAKLVNDATPSIEVDHPFSSHITLLRNRLIQDFVPVADKIGNEIVIRQRIDHFSLYESTLTKNGPIYRIIKKFELQWTV